MRFAIAKLSSLLCVSLFCVAPAFGALATERIALHQFEDGPVLPSTHVFLPGEPIFFSCRLTGFQVAQNRDEQKFVKLAWRMHITDPDGVALARDTEGRIDAQVFEQDKGWLPKFLHNFVVPPYAPGGTYRISIDVRDDVSASEFQTKFEFVVRGHPVEPSGELVVRNLHFLRTEADAPGLDPVVYHPGETLWARFDITGYKFGDKNRYSVEYGLAILKDSGEQVFTQPAAASDSSESFYPQRYVPGALSLNLNADVPLGQYTLVVMIEDKVSGQKAEARGAFQIQK
jgi:hypothetical protein